MDCYPLLGEGGPGEARDAEPAWCRPSSAACGGTFPQGKVRVPRRRKPSPTGKVDRAQPGTDEGCRAKITKQATLNGKRFRSTWPVFDFSVVFPHPSRLTACHLKRGGRRPPAGAFIPSPGRGWPGQSPGRVWGGTVSDLVPPLFRRLRRHLPPGEGKGSPAGRKPSPRGR